MRLKRRIRGMQDVEQRLIYSIVSYMIVSFEDCIS